MAKAADVLSPRLHQIPSELPAVRPGAARGNADDFTIFSYPIRSMLSRMVVHILRAVPQHGISMSAIKELTDCEAAYVAGIIDGEGTITLTRLHRDENRRAVLSISSTELPLLQYVRRIIGAGRITSKTAVKDHHSPGFTYVLTSRLALAVLARVAPHLRTYKAQRAQLLLEEYLLVTPRNGRYTAAQRQAREAFEARFFAVHVRRGLSRLRLKRGANPHDSGLPVTERTRNLRTAATPKLRLSRSISSEPRSP